MARTIAVADCETDPFMPGRIPRPFIWGFYDGEEYKEFHSTEEFIEFAKEQYCIIYAHNGGKFDWHFVLPHFDPYSDIMVINGRIARAYLGNAELRDSYSILPVPLAAYKKDEIDYAIMEKEEREKPENAAKISEYLKSDCVYLYELISGFVNTYGLQITQASAAMHQWKRINKKVPKSDKSFYEEFAPYYYGGRVQCFESGIINTDFSVFDINSAYPYAMMFAHPYSLTYSRTRGYDENGDFFRVRCRSYGAFPFRGIGGIDGKNFGLSFPSDDELREYTITNWEFNSAVETNTIEDIEVIETYCFDEHTNFSEYIQYFYNLRLKAKEAGDEANSLFAKLLMNSLYGKFAANPENYRNHMIVPMDVIGGLSSLGWNFGGELGPWALAEAPLNEDQLHYYNVATGASITGFVRAMLWRAICSSKGVLYCDTDSIAVRQAGENVVLGNALGQWKHEGDFKRAGIGGKKLYVFEPTDGGKPKHASKGVRLGIAELWEVAKGGEIEHTAEAPTFSVKKAPTFTKRRIKRTA